MLASQRVRNDERDAADLADLPWMGRLPEAWIAPPATRELRGWVRRRAKLVGLRSNLKCQVIRCGLCRGSGQFLVVVVVRLLLGSGGRRGLRPGCGSRVWSAAAGGCRRFSMYSATANRAFARVSNLSVVHLVLQGRKERLCRGVVPAHPGPLEAGLNLVAGAEAGELMRGRR